MWWLLDRDRHGENSKIHRQARARKSFCGGGDFCSGDVWKIPAAECGDFGDSGALAGCGRGSRSGSAAGLAGFSRNDFSFYRERAGIGFSVELRGSFAAGSVRLGSALRVDAGQGGIRATLAASERYFSARAGCGSTNESRGFLDGELPDDLWKNAGLWPRRSGCFFRGCLHWRGLGGDSRAAAHRLG